MSEGKSLVSGGVVTLVGQGLKFATYGLSLIVLSRLLPPEVFGAFAVMSAIIAFGELFRDFGLTAAALQVKVLHDSQANTLFWVNVAIGLTLTAGLIATAPLIASLFGQPEISSALMVLAAAFTFMGAQAQYQVRLARKRKFTSLAIADVVGQIIGVIAAILMAVQGAGIWALVAQQLTTQFIVLAIRVVLSRWRPGLPSRRAGLRGFFRYGINLGGAQLLTYSAANVDTYVISLKFGPSALGFYDRAFQLLSLPVRQVLAPLTNVFLPILAQLQDKPADFNRLLIRLQTALGAIVVWIFANAIVAAPELITLVLGAEWQDAAGIFRLLAIGGIFQVFSYFIYWTILAKGLTGVLFRYNLVTKTGTVIAIICASFVSVEVVALTYSLCLAVSWPISIFWIRKRARTNSSELLLSGLHLICSGLIAAAFTLWVDSFWPAEAPSLLISLLIVNVLFVFAALLSKRIRDLLKGSPQILKIRRGPMKRLRSR